MNTQAKLANIILFNGLVNGVFQVVEMCHGWDASSIPDRTCTGIGII